MKTNGNLMAVMALAGVIQGALASDISGKVTLKGTPPPETPIAFEQTCGKLTAAPVTTRRYQVGEGGGLANVFVYVKTGLEGKKFEAKGEPPLLDQVNCMYEPYVMGVMTNQIFNVRNSDPVMHNVHPTPKPGSANKEFNLGQPTKGQVNPKSFPNPEVLVRFKCDVHQWMFAYVGVLEHPYFAVTDKNGEFKLPSGLPAGTYTIEAFHQKTGATGAMTQEIKVGESDMKSLNFTIEVK